MPCHKKENGWKSTSSLAAAALDTADMTRRKESGVTGIPWSLDEHSSFEAKIASIRNRSDAEHRDWKKKRWEYEEKKIRWFIFKYEEIFIVRCNFIVRGGRRWFRLWKRSLRWDRDRICTNLCQKIGRKSSLWENQERKRHLWDRDKVGGVWCPD